MSHLHSLFLRDFTEQMVDLLCSNKLRVMCIALIELVSIHHKQYKINLIGCFRHHEKDNIGHLHP